MKPEFYQMKRYSLIVACCISIIGCIVYACLMPGIVDEEMTKQTFPPGTDVPALRSIAIGILIAAFGIAIVFLFFGLIGAWREHYCLTCTYTVLQVLGTLNQVAQAFNHPTILAGVVINLVVCCVAISFLMDLRKVVRNTRKTENQITDKF